MNRPLAGNDTRLLAERYDLVSDGQFRSGLNLIERLDVRKGFHILDVGCGTGRLTRHVGDLTGPTGKIVGIDPAVQRIDVALRKIRDRESTNVTFERGDANALHHFEPESFDIVYLNAVFHWVEQKEDALTQIYRILKPGGRIGIATGNREKPYTVKALVQEILKRPACRGIGNHAPDQSYPVSIGEIASLLIGTGFTLRELSSVEDPRYFESPETCIEYVEASLFGNFLVNVPSSLRGPVKRDLLKELENHRTPQGIANVYHTIFAVAEK